MFMVIRGSVPHVKFYEDGSYRRETSRTDLVRDMDTTAQFGPVDRVVLRCLRQRITTWTLACRKHDSNVAQYGRRFSFPIGDLRLEPKFRCVMRLQRKDTH